MLESLRKSQCVAEARNSPEGIEMIRLREEGPAGEHGDGVPFQDVDVVLAARVAVS